MLPSEHLKALETEYGLLKLLYHRNKNQHRATTWWKHLNTLKRSSTKLIALLQNHKPSARDKDNILNLAVYIRCVVVGKCFRAFNEIIALAQFVTLGLTLLGIVSKVDYEVSFIEGLEEKIKERKEKGVKGNALNETDSAVASYYRDNDEEIGEEIGEVIVEQKFEEVIIPKENLQNERLKQNMIRKDEVKDNEKVKKRKVSSLNNIDVEKKSSKKIKKTKSETTLKSFDLDESIPSSKDKKKKKKKKSAIDDIFGF